MENELINFITDYWQMVFIYGLKILSDINKNMVKFDKILAIHETEINALKEKNGFNRRISDKE